MAIMQFEDVGEEAFLVAEVYFLLDGAIFDIFEPKQVSAGCTATPGRVGRFLVKSFGSAAVAFGFKNGAEEIEPGGLAPGLSK